MKKIDVHTNKPYQVLVGKGLMAESGILIRQALQERGRWPGEAVKAAVITDTHVAPLCLEKLTRSLDEAGISPVSKVIEAGEASKNLFTYSGILSFLAENELTRSDIVVALGGGVVGDLGGFAAATYLRGISYVQIPTSLLAMVDSSVGGKTAVDLPAGKNLAGAFCQPEIVVCDPAVLSTLPEEIFRDGCAEVIKYGVLEDETLFSQLSRDGISFEPEEVISRCVQIKADYVSGDEFDNGIRRKLNLGHTFGHALEALSDYRMTHGQAVAAGMCIAARASFKMGFCKQACVDGIESCIGHFKLPVRSQEEPERMIPFIAADKKRRGNSVSLIVPVRIGRCDIIQVPTSEIGAWIKAGM